MSETVSETVSEIARQRVNERADAEEMSEALSVSPAPVAPRLARWMAPLALLTFSVTGVVSPWLYEQSARVKLEREARFMAQSIQERMRRVIARDPHLWSYQPQLSARVIEPFVELGAEVRCVTALGRDCSGGLRSAQRDDASATSPVSARVPLIYQGRIHGEVIVSLSTFRGAPSSGTEEINTGWINSGWVNNKQTNVWWIAIPLALLIAGLIELLPWWSARLADRENMRLWSALRMLNQTLERRVTARTQELSDAHERLLSIQEEERQRISRDLHDELGQTLTGLRLQLTHAQILNRDERLETPLSISLEVIDAGVEQVRRIAYEQRPPELDQLGLYEALEALVMRARLHERFEVKLCSPPATLRDQSLTMLSDTLSVSLFRVAQEGITNALRYSSGDLISVQVEVKLADQEALGTSEISLTVSDNGALSSGDLVWGGGISGAHGRMKRAGGELIVIARQGEGMKLVARADL